MAAYVYIMSNKSHTIYIGSTTDLLARVRQHKEKRFTKAFTARYRFTRLVYYEILMDRAEAEAREREIKGWTRKKKVELIQKENPYWMDLSGRLSD